MSVAEIIEQAHETISGWKQLLIASAIASGGQTVISPEQLLDAKSREIAIDHAPWRDIVHGTSDLQANSELYGFQITPWLTGNDQ